jgi:hypothetical protein
MLIKSKAGDLGSPLRASALAVCPRRGGREDPAGRRGHRAAGCGVIAAGMLRLASAVLFY